MCGSEVSTAPLRPTIINFVSAAGYIYQTLLRFDLSGLPPTADAAYVWLYYFNSGTPTNINWYLITKQWQSGTVSLLTTLNGAFVAETPAPTTARWYKFNVTSIYNQWRLAGNYGFQLKPVSNNNNFTTFYSSTQGGGYGPWLQVDYTPTATDSVIKLKWPLGTAYAGRVVTQAFGVNWAGGGVCSTTGVIKKHNGTDFRAVAGTAIYAAEDGIVKHKEAHSPWAYHIVIEHNHPTGGKYTTVYWHVNPSVSVGDFVPKAMQIATVADLGTNTHFHFGVRIGSCNDNVSGTGALPQTNCDGYPAFPEYFIDPNSTNNVLFQ